MKPLDPKKLPIGYERSRKFADTDKDLLQYLNLRLAAYGAPTYGDPDDFPILKMSQSLLEHIHSQHRLFGDLLCPVDLSVHRFLADYLKDVDRSDQQLWVPSSTLVLERHGLARTLSLPPDKDVFQSPILTSTRVYQGICHNPDKDRRTTAGVFHIVEGGFDVPADKKEVPKLAFAGLLKAALNPPDSLLQLPFTATQPEAKQAKVFASLLLRPIVCPEVAGFTAEKSIEVRFFAPGSLVANLDFVESIFGNAGDPFHPANDARLDVRHWSGHTGCVILAPHLTRLTKREVGLPNVKEATERQRRDGMCWQNPDELYNDGGAFKVTCRDHRGIMVTLIADNYFGYCKKEVKTQISFAANLMGICEEEHAGGALAFPSFDLGEDFEQSRYEVNVKYRFADVAKRYADFLDIQNNGYAIDTNYPDIIYLPENARIDVRSQLVTWKYHGDDQQLRLSPNCTYVMPSGYRVEMRKPHAESRWRLVGTQAEGTFCHKPCTVSGGGKSEISKPISDSMISGPVVTYNIREDFDLVEQIISRDYSDRYANRWGPSQPSRPLLSEERSLGSAVRLLTPSEDYTDEYNEWVSSIPRHIRDLVLLVKRFYRPHWTDWRKHFSVDWINGRPGYELKFRKQKLVSLLIRIGFNEDGSWRTFALRKDFFAAHKLQTEDDITATVIVPKRFLNHVHPDLNQPSYKFARNCEYRLFQRPDEAIVRGYDKTAEADFSRAGNFFSNYEPMTRDEALDMVADTIKFDQFSKPIKKVIRNFVRDSRPDYLVSTSNPRLVNGVPSKNPRYLQNRPDLDNPRDVYLALIGARLHRLVPSDQVVHFPVNSVLPGRRNNPADHKAGIRPLAVYSPIHYQELPELFMEFISSLTGKSPSTTGAGSEGALTKGPFNAMPPIVDLNNALVSYLLTENSCFTTSAGYIGPKYRFDHDISLLIPEVWSRMFIHEREPKYLIERGFLEKLDDFEYEGRTVLASRLGYRITDRFVTAFFGRMFSDPSNVFTEEMLQPELQSMEDYVDGIDNIVTTQRRIAELYFEDDTIRLACPPLRALLSIMAHGSYEGKTVQDAEIRQLFTRTALLESDWYHARLEGQKQVDCRLWKRHIDYLEHYLKDDSNPVQVDGEDVEERLALARKQLAEAEGDNYVQRLHDTLGVDPYIANQLTQEPRTQN